MGLLDLLLVAAGLSMDAFAVSVCKGLNTKMYPVKTGLVAGLYFGGFQALMPTLGYICGGTIRQYIEAVSKYVALFLLCIIGINMIRENLKGECKETNGALGFTVMVPAAIATSIDAFSVGITLSALNVKIIPSATTDRNHNILNCICRHMDWTLFRKSVRKPGRNIRRCDFNFNRGTDFYYGLTEKNWRNLRNEKTK